MLKIDRFPNAQYDPENLLGFLAYYYPFSAIREGVLTAESWRYDSYSPEILDFKEGRDDAIRRFGPPFIQLISYATELTNSTNIYLIPIPSSIAHDNPAYSRQPRPKGLQGTRNRDDRNIVFCNFICAANSNFKVADILIRTKSKIEKAQWTAEQHADSFSLQGPPSFHEKSTTVILVDDVMTGGETIMGARRVIQKAYPNLTIIALTIGRSRSPH